MAYRFPSTINAGRVAKFISTAAWLQGASAAAATAGDVWLPEEALNNFLARQTQDAPPPNNNNGNAGAAPAPAPGSEEEDDDGSESSDSSVGSAESLDSSKSSDSETSTKNGEESKDSQNNGGIGGLPVASVPVQGTIDPATGQTVMPAPANDGSGAGGTASRLSPGAQAAIAVWVVIAVVAAGAAFWWFRLRGRRKTALGEKDPEAARSQPMAAQGAMPSIVPTPQYPPPMLDTRQSVGGGDYVMRAQPWQEKNNNNSDAMSFDTRPLSQQSKRLSPSQDFYGSTVVPEPALNRSSSRIGLPSNPRPMSRASSRGSGPVIGAPMMGGPYHKDLDARTVVTADTESTIFEWR